MIHIDSVSAGSMGLGIIITLRDKASRGIETLKEKVQGLKSATTEMTHSFTEGALDFARGNTLITNGVNLLATAFSAPIEAAMNFETTMAEVNKVADLSAQEYDTMAQGLRALTRSIPVTVEQLGSIAAAAAQSGVAKSDLLDFAKQASYMGVAFDIAGGQAGQMMADWRAGMGLTLPRTYALADAVNHLSNNMNATAPALGEVIRRAGAVAKSCGLAETEVAALGAAFLSAGAAPEVAATALTNFTTTLTRGAKMPKSQIVSFLTAGGLNPVEIAAAMQKDARKTILTVLQEVAKQPKEVRMSLLSGMFGQGSVDTLAPLLENIDLLHKAFGLVGDQTQYAASMFAEYQARADTVQNALALLKNRVNDLKIAFGEAPLGPFRAIVDAVSAAVKFVATLPKPVHAALAALTALVGAGLILMGTFSSVIGILKMWNISILAAKAQTALAFANMKNIAAQFGAALTRGPLLAVTKLALAAAALHYAWKTNLLGVRDAVTALTEGFKMATDASADGIAQVDDQTYQTLQKAGVWDISVTAGRVFWRLRSFAEAFAQGWRDTLNIVGTAWNTFTDTLSGAASYFRPLLQALGLLDAAGNTNADTWREMGYWLGRLAPLVLTAYTAFKTFSAVKNIFSGVTEAITLMNTAINANPYILAFTLIATGIAYVITHWDQLKETAIAVWNTITDNLAAFADWIAGWAERIWNWLTAPFKTAWDYFTGWGETAKEIFSGVADWIASAFSAIITPFEKGFDTVKGWWRSLKSYLGFGDTPAETFAETNTAAQRGSVIVASQPIVTDRAYAPSAPGLAARGEIQARQYAAAAAQNTPKTPDTNVNVQVEPQPTILMLDGREIGRAVTRYNTHEFNRCGREVPIW